MLRGTCIGKLQGNVESSAACEMLPWPDSSTTRLKGLGFRVYLRHFTQRTASEAAKPPKSIPFRETQI